MLTIRQPRQLGRKEACDVWLGPAPWIVTPPPGPLAVAAISREQRVTSPSCERPYPLMVRRARGSIVEDVDGNRYLDFVAGIAVCSTGHCHPQVVKAVEDQAQEFVHIAGGAFYCGPTTRLAEKLTEIVPGSFPKRVLFTNSGTEAIQAAVALARHHTRRKWIIWYGGVLQRRTKERRWPADGTVPEKVQRSGPPLPMVACAPFGDLSAVEEMFRKQVPASETAAIIVEPLLAEGGGHVASPEFLQDLRRLCDEHGILLVADEIRTGMGRTGRMFACEHADVVPDIVCLAGGMASGMPLGAVVAAENVMSWPEITGGSRYGGNPVSCAAALATIALLEKRYIAKAAALGPVALGRLDRMAAKYKCVGDVRGLGLIIALDIVRNRRSMTPDPILRDRIIHGAFVRGLLLRGCGEGVIQICPPLCINHTQLEVGLDVLDEVIATVAV